MGTVRAETAREVGEAVSEAASVLLSLSAVLEMAHDGCPPGTGSGIVASLHLGARQARQVAEILDRLEARLSRMETALLRSERLAEEAGVTG